ncbi:MAG: hypothetical protein ACE5IB_03480 [Candidatus Geothermarchaeales archaeon]
MSPSPIEQVNSLIYETVEDILGGAAASVFFKQLETKHGLKASRVAETPQPFSRLLESFFGAGGQAIERAIVLKLSEQFGPEVSSKPFLEAVGDLARRGDERS